MPDNEIQKEEKLRELFLQQKQTLDIFLEHHTITKEQYETELLSIIAGNMSVIGPRPLPPSYDEYYTEDEKKRFNVRGGLIPPEVLYNNVQPTWDEQLRYEADYAETLSMKKDVEIIIAVFRGLFTRYKNDYGEYVRKSLDEERKKEETNV